MPINMSKSEFYRREADRLKSMADAETFADVKDELLGIAEQFSALSATYQTGWPRPARTPAPFQPRK